MCWRWNILNFLYLNCHESHNSFNIIILADLCSVSQMVTELACPRLDAHWLFSPESSFFISFQCHMIYTPFMYFFKLFLQCSLACPVIWLQTFFLEISWMELQEQSYKIPLYVSKHPIVGPYASLYIGNRIRLENNKRLLVSQKKSKKVLYYYWHITRCLVDLSVCVFYLTMWIKGWGECLGLRLENPQINGETFNFNENKLIPLARWAAGLLDSGGHIYPSAPVAVQQVQLTFIDLLWVDVRMMETKEKSS